MYEDHPISTVETCIDTESAIVPASVEQCDVIDLYLMEDAKNNNDKIQDCAPFLQFTSFIGPQGEIVRVQALFDEGAMTSVMCISIFEWVKHWLGNWGPSTKWLRMANGAIIQSEMVWRGEVIIRGVKAHREFEVLRSGGRWKFLLRKPMLQAFKAIHNYKSNEVQILGTGGTTTLYNQTPNNSTINIDEPGVQTLGKSGLRMGGADPPSRQVNDLSLNEPRDAADQPSKESLTTELTEHVIPTHATAQSMQSHMDR